jgi:hypothetical protein
MAKIYLDKLTTLVAELDIDDKTDSPLLLKHFFSGAAVYVNQQLCVSWSPAGLAFKLPLAQVEQLINSGQAGALKYFDKGHVKKGYAVFAAPEQQNACHWKPYFKKAIAHAIAVAIKS